MRLVKEYRIDGKEPTDEELKECVNIANSENCIIKLVFGYGKDGLQHAIHIPNTITYELLKEMYENNKYALLRGL